MTEASSEDESNVMGVPPEKALNPGSLDDPVSACKSSDGSTAREDAVCPAEAPAKWECRDGTPDEDHDWEYIRDWYGDPGVINGTADCNYKRCRQCGKEDAWDGADWGDDSEY
jgi:hypothetical protein